MRREIECALSDKMSGVWVDGRVVLHSDIIRELETKLKIATEALEPFAEAAEELPDDARCTYSLWESTAAAMLDASDLRRAAKALACIKEEG